MTDSLWDWSLRKARDAAASPSPTPGGGSIAMVSGAFGLSLIVMGLEITRAKVASAEVDSVLAEGRALLATLSDHADRDIEVFEQYMQALRLPKATDEERAARSSALQSATIAATRAPLSAAGDCLAALRYAERAARLVRANVVSDLLGGSDMLLGALKAVLRNVDINLPGLHDEALRTQLSNQARATAQQADACYASIAALAPRA
jgi:formiminotetrahydrofolate cyclodeaminase